MTELLYTVGAAKKASKRLLKGYKAGDTYSVARVAKFFSPVDEVMLARIQLVIAREQGCASWNELRTRLEK